jgi:hypothetical protein
MTSRGSTDSGDHERTAKARSSGRPSIVLRAKKYAQYSQCGPLSRGTSRPNRRQNYSDDDHDKCEGHKYEAPPVNQGNAQERSQACYPG